MRKPTLDLGLRGEPLAAFAAGLVEKSCCSRQFLLPDGFARHITEAACLKNITILARDRSGGPAGREGEPEGILVVNRTMTLECRRTSRPRTVSGPEEQEGRRA